jgi:hypothetical protein
MNCQSQSNLNWFTKEQLCGLFGIFPCHFDLFNRKKGLLTKVKCEHKVAQLYFLGINIHPLFQNPAFKDHDYYVIFDQENNKKWIIDPSLRQFSGVLEVSEF